MRRLSRAFVIFSLLLIGWLGTCELIRRQQLIRRRVSRRWIRSTCDKATKVVEDRMPANIPKIANGTISWRLL